MALVPVNLFFKKNKIYGLGSDIGAINFDVILNENHNFNSTVTTHKIENGSEISDHIRNELDNGSLTGLVTNFSVKTGFIRSNRAQDAFDLLYKLREEKVLFTIVTVMRVYREMALTSISVPRSFDTGDATVFNISFRKVNRVDLRTVVLQTSVNVRDMTKKQNRQSSVAIDQGRTTGR